MTLRKELRPDWEKAEKLYPAILKYLQDYENFHDAQPEDTPEHVYNDAYKTMEDALSRLTGKDLSKVWLWEWWEGDGIEAFAFELALPDAKKHDKLTKQDLHEIVRILNECDFPAENDFQNDFAWFTTGYYIRLLELNFKRYDHKHFATSKDKDGNIISPLTEDIVEKIWEP